MRADGLPQFVTGTCQAGDRQGREPRLEQNLDQLESRQRRVAGRFEQHCVPRGQRRPNLVRHQVEREVERGNGGHDATWNPQREAQPAGTRRGPVEGHHFAAEAAGLVGRVIERLAGAGRLESSFRQDLAFFLADDLGQFRLAVVQQLHRPAENRAAFTAREGPHLAGPLAQRLDGEGDIVPRGLRDRVEHLSIEGADHLDLSGTLLPGATQVEQHRSNSGCSRSLVVVNDQAVSVCPSGGWGWGSAGNLRPAFPAARSASPSGEPGEPKRLRPPSRDGCLSSDAAGGEHSHTLRREKAPKRRTVRACCALAPPGCGLGGRA